VGKVLSCSSLTSNIGRAGNSRIETCHLPGDGKPLGGSSAQAGRVYGIPSSRSRPMSVRISERSRCVFRSDHSVDSVAFSRGWAHSRTGPRHGRRSAGQARAGRRARRVPHPPTTVALVTSVTSATAAASECCCCCRLSEADVQDEVPDPQVQYCTTGPVHDERQEDDDDDDHHHPDEEHDNPGKGVPGYRSRSSHGRQLPGLAVLIPLRALAVSRPVVSRPRGQQAPSLFQAPEAPPGTSS
jgi:hypothetical protein